MISRSVERAGTWWCTGSDSHSPSGKWLVRCAFTVFARCEPSGPTPLAEPPTAEGLNGVWHLGLVGTFRSVCRLSHVWQLNLVPLAQLSVRIPTISLEAPIRSVCQLSLIWRLRLKSVFLPSCLAASSKLDSWINLAQNSPTQPFSQGSTQATYTDLRATEEHHRLRLPCTAKSGIARARWWSARSNKTHAEDDVEGESCSAESLFWRYPSRTSAKTVHPRYRLF